MKSPFIFDSKKEKKRYQLKKRLRNLIQMKYDLIGVPEDPRIRETLYSIEMSIFFSQYLIQDTYSQDVHDQMNALLDQTIQDEIIRMSEEDEDGISI